MTNNIPKITRKEIKNRVGEKSFQKGEAYFARGAIFDARKIGQILKANCEGSYASFYRVRVKFDKRGIAEASCSCPVGEGGYCKHIAALLLTWLNHPEEFVEIPKVEGVLARKTKEELIVLIKHMLQQEPDLELMLEMSLSEKTGKASSNPKTYRDQVKRIFRRSMHNWRGDLELVRQITTIKKTGDEFLQKKDYLQALAVYEGVAKEVIDQLETFHDEDGYIGGVVNECVERLGNYLKEDKSSQEARKKDLQVLFEIYKADIKFGGIGLSDEIPDFVFQYAHPEEKKLVAGWIDKQLSSVKGSWAKETYTNFLKKLRKD